MKTFRKVALTICLICFVPFAAAFSAHIAAYLAGCDFDMGMIDACTIAGADITPIVKAVGDIGYATFFTVPLLIVTLVAWGLAEIVHRLLRTAHN